MASYFIFPEKDATLYSSFPSMNTGRDEILELSSYENPYVTGINDVNRIVIKFPNTEIQEVLTSLVSSSVWQAHLNLYLANASEIPLDFKVLCFPLSQSWDMGTGKYLDSPMVVDGVSWIYNTQSGSTKWVTSSFNAGATGSFNVDNPGGGVWYYEKINSQSFSYVDDKDIHIDVTNVISTSSYSNGIILKLEDSVEFTINKFSLKYFSRDTSTIYPPSLEIKWKDYIIQTGSLSFLTNVVKSVVSLENNKAEYQQNSIHTFRVNARPKNPVRTFSTSSVYLNNYYLPLSSSYCVKDLDTEEEIISFDSEFTKISADSDGNYFKLYMNGLQPERYYKILIRTELNGDVIIHDNNYYFKVIR